MIIEAGYDARGKVYYLKQGYFVMQVSHSLPSPLYSLDLL